MGEAQAPVAHGAARTLQRALPGAGAGRRGRRPRRAAGAALLAGRRRAPDHLGPHHHPGPNKPRQNLGIYRQQVLSRNRLSCAGCRTAAARSISATTASPIPARRIRWRWRWAPIRRRCWARSRRCPTRCPNTSSPACCAAAARKWRPALGVPLRARPRRDRAGRAYPPDPAHASGYEHALEGPYGDHTGYYNEQASFPVLTVDRITMRRDPIYHSTYTGKPPDEPAVLGLAMNELFIPLLQRQFPRSWTSTCRRRRAATAWRW